MREVSSDQAIKFRDEGRAVARRQIRNTAEVELQRALRRRRIPTSRMRHKEPPGNDRPKRGEVQAEIDATYEPESVAEKESVLRRYHPAAAISRRLKTLQILMPIGQVQHLFLGDRKERKLLRSPFGTYQP